MAAYVYWFLAGLVLVGLEMVTGTFYLLMLGIALAIGGCAALLGLGTPMQFTLAAIAGIAGTIVLHKTRGLRPAGQTGQSLDIGQTVKVVAWRDNGTGRVYYRGAEWDAEPESHDMPRDGALYIKALRGSTLILTHHKP
ncbi:MAG: hypothetical protein A2286_05065 [Gammaproteobacteria bacterium RIFOXYA12_FULL_61_12]|nr:MAG: hypothetical protein A2514_01575 [Gammaproteobacteria bacterium RIFOXYD12_FULL_61_37]OGT93689.1 MAG: hypothetical protein A2286_05065 [Gammaproteobacteria bacterium RIFOXYA12_FULL_61_12]